MDSASQWGIGIILALQEHSPGLDTLMKFLSFLGTEEFFMILVPFLYWCVSASLGLRLLAVLILSDFTNGLLKWAFHSPRPYWVEPGVKAIAAEASYGLPSGHAQTATVVWGTLARLTRGRWAYPAAAVLVLGISVSRLYLGVHFPGDVLAGWAAGVAVWVVYVWAEPRLSAWLGPRSLPAQIGAACLLTAVMLGAAAAVGGALAGVADPPGWEAQAAAASPPAAGRTATDPRRRDGQFAIMGIAFGAGVGFAVARRGARFDPRGPWPKRLARLAIGLAVLVLLRVGLGAIFPREPEEVAMLFRFVRYAIMGLWAVWLAPLVFVRTGLADEAQS